MEGPKSSCTRLRDSRSVSYCEFPIVSRVSNRASAHTLYSQYVDFRLFFGSSVCVICQKQKKNILFLTKILSFFFPEQISWQNSIVLSMFCFFFVTKFRTKWVAVRHFFFVVHARSPKELILLVICCVFFSGDGSDIVFLVIATASPAQLARHALLGTFLEMFYNADWKVLIWYLAAAIFFASNDKEYQ